MSVAATCDFLHPSVGRLTDHVQHIHPHISASPRLPGPASLISPAWSTPTASRRPQVPGIHPPRSDPASEPPQATDLLSDATKCNDEPSPRRPGVHHPASRQWPAWSDQYAVSCLQPASVVPAQWSEASRSSCLAYVQHCCTFPAWSSVWRSSEPGPSKPLRRSTTHGRSHGVKYYLQPRSRRSGSNNEHGSTPWPHGNVSSISSSDAHVTA